MAFNRSFLSLFALVSLLTNISSTLAFPSYSSLAGLSEREVEELVARLPQVLPPNPPGPLEFNGTKLYLPRDGVATPTQIIQAVQEGFNMDSGTARFVVYAAHLVDGNLVTDLLSIGGKTKKTGADPPPPAIVG
ncbi:hypothetical protein FA13DRAFT_1718659, partial [Coprinellus micaceus]